jgi:hypothetical protein
MAAILAAAACILFAGCAGSGKSIPSPTYTPTKAPTELLIERCENLPETQEVKCPLNVFLKSLYNFTDLWDYSQKCGVRLAACQAFGAVDKAEMQGKINEQAARADRNAKWIWIVGGIGGVLTVLAFIAGAIAL